MTSLRKCAACKETFQTDEGDLDVQCPHCGSLKSRVLQKLYCFLGISSKP